MPLKVRRFIIDAVYAIVTGMMVAEESLPASATILLRDGESVLVHLCDWECRLSYSTRVDHVSKHTILHGNFHRG